MGIEQENTHEANNTSAIESYVQENLDQRIARVQQLEDLWSDPLSEEERDQVQNSILHTLLQNPEIAERSEQWKQMAERLFKGFEDNLSWAVKGDAQRKEFYQDKYSGWQKQLGFDSFSGMRDNLVAVSDPEFEMILKRVN